MNKTFNGKVYKYIKGFRLKREAIAYAKIMRKKGYLARVVYEVLDAYAFAAKSYWSVYIKAGWR